MRKQQQHKRNSNGNENPSHRIVRESEAILDLQQNLELEL